MKRRAFIGTAAAAAFAGCTGVGGNSAGEPTEANPTTDGTTTDNTTTDETTTTIPGEDEEAFYALEVIETDPAPAEDVEMNVAVTESFTSEHPAELRVEFTNTADEQRKFQFGSLVPWDAIWGDAVGGSGRLLLAPGDGVAPDEPEDQCWRAMDGLALPAVMRSETLDAGETASQEFHVLATKDSETCHEPGDYRFRDDGYLESGWGFTVTVGGGSTGNEA